MIMLGWFSGGVTSAVSIKVALDAGHDVKIFYMETGNHHPDHARFIDDCSKWYGRDIVTLKSDKYKDVHDVILKTRYINGPTGARCTNELKKKLRINIQKIIPHEYQIFGFEYEKSQINRAIRFNEQYPEAKAIYPLIELMIDKQKAMKIIQDAGIELPMMYKLGFSNSNCIGCVKGGAGYWNYIRKVFPDVFNKMASIERELNNSCLKRDGKKIFLDELEPEAGRHESIALPECGVVCPVELDGLKVIDDSSLVSTGLFSGNDWL
jgi:hypothetical protein